MSLKEKENNKKITSKPKREGFFKSHINELKKVKWPTVKEMTKYSIAVLAFCIFFGAFFYGINFLVALLKGIVS